MSIIDDLCPPAEDLGSRLEFETLISNTFASLFSAAPEQIHLVIERALGGVRDFFQADGCGLLSITPDQQVINVRLASYGEGVSPVSPQVNLAPLFPWAARTVFVDRAPVRVSRLAELPPEADVDRRAWEEMLARSALILPIETRRCVGHAIVLQAVHAERDWPDAFLPRLRLLGEMLVSALERQEMVTGLRDSEARLTLAADSAEAGFWTLNYRTGVFWVTERTRAIFGYALDDVITLARVEGSVHPDDWDLVRGAIDGAAVPDARVKVDYRIIRDGAVRWVTSSGRPHFTSAGERDRLMGVSIDITERRRAEEALRTSEARLVAAADLAGLAFYEIDYTDGSMYVDDRFRELCGLPADREQGLEALQFWIEQLHPDDRQRVLIMRRELHEGGRDRLSTEYRFLHPVQGPKWIQHLARIARRDAGGHAVVAYGVLRDVTARKRVEDELRDLSRRLIRAHEEERALLARELHDDVSQRLAVLAIDVGRAERGALDGMQAMHAVREGLVRLSEDIHSLAYQLHPSVLEELGLAEALRTECERRGRRSQFSVSVDVHPLPPVERDAALCIFRVAQEALNNVARHAGARSASVTLRPVDDALLLAVCDDGAGFDPEHMGRRRSLGLASMRERLRLVKGTLDIESAPGHGTSVVAWIPMERGAE